MQISTQGQATQQTLEMVKVKQLEDGSIVPIEDLGLQGYYHKNPFKRWWMYVKCPRVSPLWSYARWARMEFAQAREEYRQARRGE